MVDWNFQWAVLHAQNLTRPALSCGFFHAQVTNSFAYFIQSIEGGPIKIGHAENPKQRLSLLQSGNPQELRVTRVVEGGYKVEQQLHRIFSEHRIRGEWFEPVSALAKVANAIPGEEGSINYGDWDKHELDVPATSTRPEFRPVRWSNFTDRVLTGIALEQKRGV